MNNDALSLYNATAHRSAAVVISRYSTSFGWASKLMSPRQRQHIENIYALVRVADELVDGPAGAAGVDASLQRQLLDELESETERAIAIGFSTNLVVHAFAQTARAHGIDMSLCRPFFGSMRQDLSTSDYKEEELKRYIYGSAEVVGLMCLAVFEAGRIRSTRDTETITAGARSLGAAFQKINFLRDLATDEDGLGRTYLAVSVTQFDDDAKQRIIADIRADLTASGHAITLLSPDARAAVWAAHALFTELAHRIDQAPADTLRERRISVPTSVKLQIVSRALARKAVRR